jgi:hypothetical protein
MSSGAHQHPQQQEAPWSRCAFDRHCNMVLENVPEMWNEIAG